MASDGLLTTKQTVLRAIESLPEDVTFDEILDCIEFVRNVEAGLEDARQGRLIPHAEVKKQFAQWLASVDRPAGC